MAEFSKVKLPKWIPDKPDLWFTIAENTMRMSKIESQEQKYIVVSAGLPVEVAITVEKAIRFPTAGRQYDGLKAAVLGKHSESPEEAHLWMKTARLGDQKPSALAERFISKIPSCTEAKCPAATWHFRNTFEAAMPTHVRNGLVAKELDYSDPTEYLALADKLYDAGKAAQAAAVEVDGSTGGDETAAVTKNNRDNKRNTRKNAGDRDPTCFIHKKYGADSYKCADPERCPKRDKIKPPKKD